MGATGVEKWPKGPIDNKGLWPAPRPSRVTNDRTSWLAAEVAAIAGNGVLLSPDGFPSLRLADRSALCTVSAAWP